MNVDKNLEQEVLTRLLHAHPNGLGKEVLDNYRGEKVVASVLALLQDRGFIKDGHVTTDAAGDYALNLPIKLTASGVEEARKLESQTRQ
ncbi:hypothetical protein A7317_22185 [Pseudomonas fluorescens]|jgi:hypothetical protein|uniref:Uncharacterized protein n=4 Tax=Pseudomonas TaxID=286 RepID=A0A5M9IRS1_9PSED|nr:MULTISPECIES: hypothetical protein [Pseudomonas]AHC37366.1 hypothetical protein U771_24385 [Pseudomonas sp. TKP]AOE69600.1 hypothetical protein A7317_22185 [Pseudomonas fluorescens]AOE75376.1 hypothetical protein A7319_21955 [Pseudomonas fluorescens]KAA6170112.1 hypothetical protein F3K54_24970 [Pseudomonas veronii]KAA6173239.1 hypothetical protein F3K53_23655 [Pseudomonas veronii]